MQYADLHSQERVYEVQVALAHVRSELELPAPTRVVADKIARLLGWQSADVGRILVQNFAKPPYALPGPMAKRYGRFQRTWLWQPAEKAGQAPADLIA